MFLKDKSLIRKIGFFSLLAGAAVLFTTLTLRSMDKPSGFKMLALGRVPVEPEPAPQPKSSKPERVRGVHLTSWVAGSKKLRAKIDALFAETEINAVVVAIKEYQGEVYIPGVALAEKHKLYVNAIPDIKEYLAALKSRGVYTIARIVVFKDNGLARKKPEWAVKRPDGSVWQDHAKNAWVDPYNKEVWDYNLDIAEQAVALGFQEIQFDYIRFPSDGDIKQCRYSYAQHSSSASARALNGFLELAAKRLKPLGVETSIDIFGLTPSVQHDMGIGQKIMQMTQFVDYVSPMVYPSHYAKGEYGIPVPNAEPYKVVHKTISDAIKRMGVDSKRLRPYLQDFSLGHKYGPKEVRAQIMACEDQGIYDWLLWNPSCRYTVSALRDKNGKLPEAAVVPESMRQVLQEKTREPKTKVSTAPAAAPEGEKK